MLFGFAKGSNHINLNAHGNNVLIGKAINVPPLALLHSCCVGQPNVTKKWFESIIYVEGNTKLICNMFPYKHFYANYLIRKAGWKGQNLTKNFYNMAFYPRMRCFSFSFVHKDLMQHDRSLVLTN